MVAVERLDEISHVFAWSQKGCCELRRASLLV